jgi:hypothetical protein
MTDLTFKVAKRRIEPITFSIEGSDHVYSFTPPKTAAMVLPMMESAENGLKATKAAFEWLDQGLSTEDQDHMSNRLRDPEDDFDVSELEDIVVGLVEAIGARPTT